MNVPALSRSRRLWRQHLRPLIILLFVLGCFRSSVADWNDVPTQSMEPTILTGDRIVVNKLAYGLRVPFTTMHVAMWSTPDRGDIVVFFAPHNGDRTVKRVIGVPGDRIAMRDGRLVINGLSVQFEPRTAWEIDVPDLTDPAPHAFGAETLDSVEHAVMALPSRRAMRSFDEITIPPGHVFVMGDNRDNSRDSRSWGVVPCEKIVGRAFALAVSFDRDDHYTPRWRRFGRSIR